MTPPSNEDSSNFDADWDELADRFALAIRNGQSPAIDDFVDDSNADAAELRKLLESIQLVEGLKKDALDSDLNASSNSISHEVGATDIPDYTIVSEIGRGGMGVVYEAIHNSLGRRVAIKVLSGSLLNESKSVARFRIEARAAAKLRHSNIVPVFGVGQTEKLHYYVMDFIAGESLSERMKSLTNHQRINQVTQAAEDCSKATGWSIDSSTRSSSEELVLSIGDFGSEVSPDGLADTAEELPVDVLASGPERTVQGIATETVAENSGWLGRASKKQTDVDGQVIEGWRTRKHVQWAAKIGATIAEAIDYAHEQGVLHRDIKPANLLLDQSGEVWIADFGLAKLSEQQDVTKTGDVIGTPQYMPPEVFEGRYDSRSEIYAIGLTLYEMLTGQPAIDGRSVSETIRLATAGVKTAPRILNSMVPKDLNTIVMKSLSLQPQQRYGSAKELASDLRNFLANRPISARKLTSLQRFSRWARREPVVATLLVSVIGLLTALASVSAWGYFSTRSALSTAEVATERALAAKKETDSALESVRELLKLKQVEFDRAEANLQSALSTFDELMENISERDGLSESNLIMTDSDSVEASVNEKDAELLEILVRYLDELGEKNSEDLGAQVAQAALRAGDIYVSLGNLRKADMAYSTALDRYQHLLDLRRDDAELVATTAEIMNRQLVLNSVRRRVSRGIAIYQKIRELIEQSSLRSAPSIRFELAKANRLVATLGVKTETNPGVSRPPRGGGPPRGPLRDMQLRISRTAGLQPRRGENERRKLVERTIQASIQILQSLLTEEPNSIKYRVELARAYRNAAELKSRFQVDDDANRLNQQSIVLLKELAANENAGHGIEFEYALSLLNTADCSADFQKNIGEAERILRRLESLSDSIPRYRAIQAVAFQRKADALVESGRITQAIMQYRKAASAYRMLLRDAPELRGYVGQLLAVTESLSDLLALQGKTEAAIEQLRLVLDRKMLKRVRLSPADRAVKSRLQNRLEELQSASE